MSLRVPAEYADVAGRRLVQFLAAVVKSFGRDPSFPQERLTRFRTELLNTITNDARFGFHPESGRPLLVCSVSLAQHNGAMERAGICPCCCALLEAQFSMVSSDGWKPCRKCVGPCDPTYTHCALRKHSGECVLPEEGANSNWTIALDAEGETAPPSGN